MFLLPFVPGQIAYFSCSPILYTLSQRSFTPCSSACRRPRVAMSSRNQQAYGRDFTYWSSISTISSCRKAIELWGTEDQMPKSKAPKAEVVEVALRVATSRTPQPGAVQFFNVISGGKDIPDWLKLQQGQSVRKPKPSGTTGTQQTRPDIGIAGADPTCVGNSNPTGNPGPSTSGGPGNISFPRSQGLQQPAGPANHPATPSTPSHPLVELNRRRPLVTNNGASWRDIFEEVQIKALHRGTEVARDAPRTVSNLRSAKDLASINTKTLEGLFNDKDDPRISHVRVRFYEYDLSIVGFVNGNQEVLDRPRSYFPIQDYMFSGAGKLYPYRGRGPVWGNNSCALDCVLVAARLLDIGLTTADIGNPTREQWLASLDDFEVAFIDTVHADWDIYTEETSIARRRLFMNQFLDRSNSKKPATAPKSLLGNFLASTAVWEECTSMARQFAFRTYPINICASCGYSKPFERNEGELRSITLSDPTPTQNSDTSMAELLQRWFGVPGQAEHRQHRLPNGCGGRGLFTRRVIVGEMPHRLAVLPSTQYRNIRGATDDTINFQYRGPDEREHPVIYRWLGGIYKQMNHFRVYWRDNSYPDLSGNIKIYDGKLLLGTLLGGVPPQHPEYKVVDWWAGGTDILFYERVDVNDAYVASKITQEVSQKIAARFEKQVKNESGPSTVTSPQNTTGSSPQEGTGGSTRSASQRGGIPGALKENPIILQSSKDTKGEGKAISDNLPDDVGRSSISKTGFPLAKDNPSEGTLKKPLSTAGTKRARSTSPDPVTELGAEPKKPRSSNP